MRPIRQRRVGLGNHEVTSDQVGGDLSHANLWRPMAKVQSSFCHLMRKHLELINETSCIRYSRPTSYKPSRTAFSYPSIVPSTRSVTHGTTLHNLLIFSRGICHVANRKWAETPETLLGRGDNSESINGEGLSSYIFPYHDSTFLFPSPIINLSIKCDLIVTFDKPL